MTHQEMIDVIAAHRDGKKIQVNGSGGIWADTDHPTWNFYSNEYRVKPEPMEIEVWFERATILFARKEPSPPETIKEYESHGWTKKTFIEKV